MFTWFREAMRGVRLAVLDVAIVALIILWGNKWGGSTQYSVLSTQLPYGELIIQAATRHGLEPALLAGLVQVESGFNPAAVSGAGAMGLTQIMPETAEELGLERPFDPAENLDAGARYLAWLIEYFEGDVKRALMAYHGGPGRIAAGEERPIDVQYAVDVLVAAEAISHQPSAISLPYAEWAKPAMTQGWHGVAGYMGEDWAAGCGTPLVAPMSGVVTYNGLDGYNHTEGGRVWPQSSMLIIASGDTEVVLLHGDFIAQVGQQVVAGVTVVGFEDKIGWATGCHTHMAVRIGGHNIHKEIIR